MSKFLRMQLLPIAALLFVGCGNKPVQQSQRLVLKDAALNIPILEPSFLTEDCGKGLDFSEITEFGCVAFPSAREDVDGKDWEAEYGGLLNEAGWDWKGGEGNAYYFEKPIDENCSLSLVMVGWFQGTVEQTKAYEETGSLDGIGNSLFIFGIEPEPVCGDDRRKW